MKKIVFLITGFLFSFSQAFALVSTNEVKITEPLGGEILLGKTLFRDTITEGIKSSYIFKQLIPFLIKYGIRLAVALSVIALIVGGYQFIAAFGSSEKRQEAQKTVMYALIGLVLALTAYGIVKILT